MDAVLLTALAMLILAVCRVHVVLALFIDVLVGGLSVDMRLGAATVTFQEGLSGGVKIALNYAILGAFIMAVTSPGLLKLSADWLVTKIGTGDEDAKSRAEARVRWGMIAGILAMAIMPQDLIPAYIAFIPLIAPPLLPVFNCLSIDRQMVTSVVTFGLVVTCIWVPVELGSIFLSDVLLRDIENAGLDVSNISIVMTMDVPTLDMLAGLTIAVFFSYRKPRHCGDRPIVQSSHAESRSNEPISRCRVIVALVAVVMTFVAQIVMNSMKTDVGPLLTSALTGLVIFTLTGTVRWYKVDDVFITGMKMMALIGFITVSAQGFASVMSRSGQVEPSTTAIAELFAGSKPAATFAILVVDLVVTMGIGSSFSTLPIISIIYVPLCLSLGLSPVATVTIIGATSTLGGVGSPVSDPMLGPTMGLNTDGQHDHVRDSVISTFLHFNLPLLVAGWVAALAS